MVKSLQGYAWGNVFTLRAGPPLRLANDCPIECLADRIPQVWLSVEAVTAWVLGRLDLAAEVNQLRLEGAQKAIDDAKRGG